MKRLLFTTLVVLACGSAVALPLGNPSEASLYKTGICWEGACCDPCDPCFTWCDAWSVRIGFYGDYVFNRNLEVDGGNGSDIQKTEIYTNAGYLAFNFYDRFDVFTTLGATDIHITADASAFNFLSNVESEIAFETAFSWSVGARGTLWECGCFSLGVEGQYFQTKTDADYFLAKDSGTLTYLNNADATYCEWQVGVGISYHYVTTCPRLALVPYIGIKWAEAKLDLDDFMFQVNVPTLTDLTLPDLEAKKVWGFAVGTTITLCDTLGVTIEGRFADEKALHVQGQFRF